MNLAQLQPEIQAYLDQTLPPVQKATFEALLNDSPELREAVNEYRRLRIMHQNAALLQARTQLRQIMEEVPLPSAPDAPPQGFRWGWYLTVGALLLSLLGGGVWGWNQYTQRQATEQTLRELLEPMDNYIGFAPDDASTAAQAMRAYDAQNYAAALPHFEEALAVQPNDHSLKLYLAISHLMQQQWAPAQTLLEEIVKEDDLATVPAKWYLSLCYVHAGNKSGAKALWQALSSDPVFGPRATELLKE